MVQFWWWNLPGTKTRKHLPDDVVFDILSRLPVKTLGRFRCVSKQWNSLIHDPTFIDFHLSTEKSCVEYFSGAEIISTISRTGGKQFLMLYFFRKNESTLLCRETPNNTLIRHDNIAACNGLLCTGSFLSGWYANRTYCIQVRNPAMNEILSLPTVFMDYIWRYQCVTMLGIGFDYILKKYKVVLWETKRDSHPMIITLGTNSWREISGPLVHSKCEYRRVTHGTVYLNGASHWCTESGIISFTFTEEKFGHIPFPADMLCDYTLCDMCLVEDRLCIVDERKDVAKVNMWLLVDYYKHEWIRKQIHLQCRDQVGKVLPIRYGEILVNSEGTGSGKVYLCQYDQDGQIVKSTEVCKLPYAINERFEQFRCNPLILFTESLVSLKHIDGSSEADELPKTKNVPLWQKYRQLKFVSKQQTRIFSLMS